MIDIIVTLKNAEVRGVERKISSKGNEYLVVRVDDERGERSELLDRDVDNEQYYKRGTFGDFLLHVSIAKYAKCEVKQFRAAGAAQKQSAGKKPSGPPMMGDPVDD
jgi:hypothetical protein